MTTFTENPAGPSSTRAGTGRFGLGLVIGVLIAAVVAVVLYLTDVVRLGADDEVSGPDMTPITMPAQLGSYAPTVEQIKKMTSDPEPLAAQEVRLAKQADATTRALSQAYGGAAAAYQAYADDALMSLSYATAVRGPSPRLFLPQVTDPADLGMAVNRENLATVGDVDCSYGYTQTYTADTTPDPEELRISLCQRTGPNLTVRFYVAGSPVPTDGEESKDAIQVYVDLTNELWDSVSGTTTAATTQ